MKKLSLVACFCCVAAWYSFAGGVVEYKGQNYVASPYGSNIAAAYEAKKDIGEDFFSIITNGNLYFIGPVAPMDKDAVIQRGIIQKGDKFFLSDEYPNVVGVYTGPKKAIAQAFKDEEPFLAVGYATRGKGVVLTEVVITQEEYDTLVKSLKEVKE